MLDILKVDYMKDGTKIQVEDWSNDYDFMPVNGTLAAYPVSKANGEGQFAPRVGKTFRMSFNFDSEIDTKQSFDELLNGSKSLSCLRKNINVLSNLDYI